MPINDRDFDQLSAYLDNALSAAERAALERRLASELGLRAALDDLRMMRQLLRALPTLKAPRDFALTPAQARPRPALITFASSPAVTSISAAAAVVLIVAGVLLTVAPSGRIDAPNAVALLATATVEIAEGEASAVTDALDQSAKTVEADPTIASDLAANAAASSVAQAGASTQIAQFAAPQPAATQITRPSSPEGDAAVAMSVPATTMAFATNAPPDPAILSGAAAALPSLAQPDMMFESAPSDAAAGNIASAGLAGGDEAQTGLFAVSTSTAPPTAARMAAATAVSSATALPSAPAEATDDMARRDVDDETLRAGDRSALNLLVVGGLLGGVALITLIVRRLTR